MASEDLDALLARMPEIAEAVNRFKSEQIQESAFSALVAAFTRAPGDDITPQQQDLDTVDEAASGPQPAADGKPASPAARAKKSPTKKSSSRKQTFTLVKNVDFIGAASPTFRDFTAGKKPGSNLEKALIALYWLGRIAEVAPVTVDHIYTAFKFMNWAVPADLMNTLHRAGSAGWIDSKKRDDLKVVVSGENHVEHEMPGANKSRGQK